MTPIENWRTRVLSWFLLLLASMCAYACTPATYSEEQTEHGRVEQMSPTLGAQEVVFSCEHGTFAIEGEAAAELVRKVKVGDSVTMVYREVYDGADGTVLDFRFVDAQPRGR